MGRVNAISVADWQQTVDQCRVNRQQSAENERRTEEVREDDHRSCTEHRF